MDRHGSPGLGPRNDGARISKPGSAADKLAALKARVAAAVGTNQAKPALGGGLPNGSNARPAGGLGVGLHPALADLTPKATGGLNVGLHPALADLSAPSKPSLSGPSFSKQPQKKQDAANNPYLVNDAGPTEGVKPRLPRKLVFTQPGKHIQQANALRRQAKLEELRRKIAQQTRLAGIDEDIDVEKNFVVEAPPDIEWWDEGLVDGKSYDNIEDPARLKINTPDSIVTEYVQHPVPLEPPQEKFTPAPKPMYLTQKETKKLRRQRRLAEAKERQMKIRLGLEPAPKDKVKRGNMMRVLGEEAVKDPTAVEARVNREIAERHEQHVQQNHERMLTKEQKLEKIAANQAKDAEKGLHVLVFKVNSLVNPQHRFKIDMNAKQDALTGVCIMTPSFNLVVVEGGEHSIKHYKKLMLNRIDWTENVAPRKDERSQALKDWLKSESEDGQLKSLATNKCQLIFEGDIKVRAFRHWRTITCETDADARDALSRAKMESFWNLAKSTQ
ncbi:PRP3-domain-containing protein [Pleurostoma richardsiae]|uniref:PRP3-domain-containing protein n=1 Tax=Pleurostoma richardsiae TaxID=41990 RepID=A0AA38W0S5_9PEZI|nr:PRP3-domain-containing protein [Pleurostoma richardsiae]